MKKMFITQNLGDILDVVTLALIACRAEVTMCRVIGVLTAHGCTPSQKTEKLHNSVHCECDVYKIVCSWKRFIV